jgi:hypothetical protein
LNPGRWNKIGIKRSTQEVGEKVGEGLDGKRII